MSINLQLAEFSVYGSIVPCSVFFWALLDFILNDPCNWSFYGYPGRFARSWDGNFQSIVFIYNSVNGTNNVFSTFLRLITW